MKKSVYIIFLVLSALLMFFSAAFAVRANDLRSEYTYLFTSSDTSDEYNFYRSRIIEQENTRNGWIVAACIGGVSVIVFSVLFSASGNKPSSGERSEKRQPEPEPEPKSVPSSPEPPSDNMSLRSYGEPSRVAGFHMCVFAATHGLPLPPGYKQTDGVNNFTYSDKIPRDYEYEMKLFSLMYQKKAKDDINTVRGWVVFFGVMYILGIVVSFFALPAILRAF